MAGASTVQSIDMESISLLSRTKDFKNVVAYLAVSHRSNVEGEI